MYRTGRTTKGPEALPEHLPEPPATEALRRALDRCGLRLKLKHNPVDKENMQQVLMLIAQSAMPGLGGSYLSLLMHDLQLGEHTTQ